MSSTICKSVSTLDPFTRLDTHELVAIERIERRVKGVDF